MRLVCFAYVWGFMFQRKFFHTPSVLLKGGRKDEKVKKEEKEREKVFIFFLGLLTKSFFLLLLPSKMSLSSFHSQQNKCHVSAIEATNTLSSFIGSSSSPFSKIAELCEIASGGGGEIKIIVVIGSWEVDAKGRERARYFEF